MKLKETVEKFPLTEVWNDSCSESELRYAVDNGAVGATTNPVIVHQVLKDNLKQWEPRIIEIIKEDPTLTEDEVAWKIIGELGTKASYILRDIYTENRGKKGRISFQVNAKYDRNTDRIVKHALELAALVPNSQIKAPTSKEGIAAFEELTYQGVSINATVSFTYAQAIAVAEAVERGLNRRVAEGKPIDEMNPVCTLMVGRLDDYLKIYVDENKIDINKEALEWAGIAVAKKAYQTYMEKKYRTKILIAAYRNEYQWTELIGGSIVLTIPYKWQVQFNNSEAKLRNSISEPVSSEIMNELLKLDEFKKAYNPEDLKPEEFHLFGSYKRTINQFLNGYDSFVQLIRAYKIKL